MKKRTIGQRKAFSLIEVIAAVIILAVVATATVATIVPMREKSKVKLDQQNIAKLDSLCQAYYMEYGAWPDANLYWLKQRGFSSVYPNPTPYGGIYKFDATTKKVVNNYVPAP